VIEYIIALIAIAVVAWLLKVRMKASALVLAFILFMVAGLIWGCSSQLLQDSALRLDNKPTVQLCSVRDILAALASGRQKSQRLTLSQGG